MVMCRATAVLFQSPHIKLSASLRNRRCFYDPAMEWGLAYRVSSIGQCVCLHVSAWVCPILVRSTTSTFMNGF